MCFQCCLKRMAGQVALEAGCRLGDTQVRGWTDNSVSGRAWPLSRTHPRPGLAPCLLPGRPVGMGTSSRSYHQAPRRSGLDAECTGGPSLPVLPVAPSASGPGQVEGDSLGLSRRLVKTRLASPEFTYFFNPGPQVHGSLEVQ